MNKYKKGIIVSSIFLILFGLIFIGLIVLFSMNTITLTIPLLDNASKGIIIAILVILALYTLVKARNMLKHHRRLGDRYDGWKLSKIDPFFKIIPYIMKSRVDAQVHFKDRVRLDHTEEYMKQKRKEGVQIGFLHILIASMVRAISQKPKLNRFVSGRKLFARNGIYISLAIKKDMTEGSAETTVKIKFDPKDTIYDVMERINKVIEENKNVQVNNDADKTAKLVMMLPSLFVRAVVRFLTWLDHHGWMPKIINQVSPFHTSVFVVDLGSLGIQPVYHHIYKFGTTSLFVALGIKEKEKIINRKNEFEEHRYIDIKIVTDERIVDGFYYAKAFRIFRRFMEKPELLELPNDKIIEDEEI